jgi:ABC-type anion transport system duplicated permease subunit
MIGIWTIVFIAVAVLAVIMIATLVWMSIYLRETIGKKHRELEAILETRTIPEPWVKAAKGDLADPSIQRRLSKLTNYVRRTRLVDSEETRNSLLDDLTVIREEWMCRYVNEYAGNRH